MHDHESGEVAAFVGKRQIVWQAGHAGLCCFPDQPLAVLEWTPFRCLMVADTSTVLMCGQTLESARFVKTVLAPGDQEGDFDNGYTGIASVYSDKELLLGFYHAEDRVGMPRVADNPAIPGGYWAVGIAVSNDNGETFEKCGPVLRASITKDQATHGLQGIGEVSVIPNAERTHLFAYYTDLTRRPEDQKARICVARCPISGVGNTGTWRKYSDGDFKEDGLGGNESAIVHPPAASEVSTPHVTYVSEWGEYLMVCHVFADHDNADSTANDSGIGFCHSHDGIKWSEPKVLVNGLPVPRPGKEYVGHPSLCLDRKTPDKLEGWVLFAYSPQWGSPLPRQLHHLARCSITITR